MTERPPNARPSGFTDRTHNSHRHQPAGNERGDGTLTATAVRAHLGSHRSERMHREDDHTGAHHRSTRMGRHHTDPNQDPWNR